MKFNYDQTVAQPALGVGETVPGGLLFSPEEIELLDELELAGGDGLRRDAVQSSLLGNLVRISRRDSWADGLLAQVGVSWKVGKRIMLAGDLLGTCEYLMYSGTAREQVLDDQSTRF